MTVGRDVCECGMDVVLVALEPAAHAAFHRTVLRKRESVVDERLFTVDEVRRMMVQAGVPDLTIDVALRTVRGG